MGVFGGDPMWKLLGGEAEVPANPCPCAKEKGVGTVSEWGVGVGG